jgi:uncharacterized membrane protein YedE/YeeE
MAGALLPMAIAWRVKKRLDRPLVGDAFNIPQTTPVDARLVAGAALFGVGWGLAGVCPGPAIVGLALAPEKAALFIVAMAAGMVLHRLLTRPFARSDAAPRSTGG